MVETVINVNDGFVQITAVGGETDLDFDFPIYAKSHIRIVRTRSGTNTALVLNTDYTIADGELEVTAGGTAVLAGAASPAVAGDVYTLLLDVPEARTTDFTQAGDLFAATLNEELDLYAQMAQGLRRDVDRAARLAETSALTSLTLPTPVASGIWKWNAAANAIVFEVAADIDLATVSPFVETLIDDTTAASFMTTLGITAAAQTILDDATVAAMVDTLGGASSTGTGGLVRATSPTLVTPVLGVATATSINLGETTLDTYEVSSFTAAHTGAITGNTTVATVRIGSSVTLSFPVNRVAGASSGTPITISGLPASLNPATEFRMLMLGVTDNGADLVPPGLLRVTSSGSIIIYPTIALGNFTSSANTTGYYGFNVTYKV